MLHTSYSGRCSFDSGILTTISVWRDRCYLGGALKSGLISTAMSGGMVRYDGRFAMLAARGSHPSILQ